MPIRSWSRPLTGAIALLGLGLGLTAWPALAKEEAWRHEGAAAFAKAQKDAVVVTESGLVRLARPIERVGAGLDAARVWALARGRDGSLYAATGDAGKVFRKGPGDQDAWQAAYDADDTQALSLASTSDGRVFVGTGPSGRVIDVSDPGHPGGQPGPDVQYVWSLATAPDGALYAATGPNGQLFRRAPGAAEWTVVLDTPQRHLLSLAIAPDGTVYTGTDRDGLIYRVPRQGQSTVVYDAPQGEIQTLAIGPDGALYAGTASAAEEGSGGGRGGNARLVPEGPTWLRTATPTAHRPAIRLARQEPKPPVDAPGGTARPKAGPPGENAVYRIGDDGAARELFRAKTLVYSLAWQADRLLIGTGPEGRLIEVEAQGREQTNLARIDHGQILALLPEPSGAVLIAAGDPGGVLRLEAGHAASGTLTSEVLDTKLASRFGALNLRADLPDGTALTVQVRTGPVGEPGPSWSDWSRAVTAPEGGRPEVPQGRFAQYRLRLETQDPKLTPVLRHLALFYRTLNLPPELGRITVPDLTAGDGSSRKTRLELKWEASDPNDDPLVYRLSIRKDGWPEWLPLGGPTPLTDRTFTWDSTTLPAGRYRVRLTASDRNANRPEEALSASLTSDSFVVDHQPPTLAITPAADGRGAKVELRDELTRLVSAEYALDGGDWTGLFPADGLFDGTQETVTVALPELAPGVHVLVVRTLDAAGNPGAADVVLQVR